MITDVRLAAGGIAPVPVRLKGAEQVMIGKERSKELAEQAFEQVMKDAVPMKENRYKLQELKTQLVRSLGSE